MTAPRPNPLLSDRDVDFQLDEVVRVAALCELPAFAEHSRETFGLLLDSARRFAREVLYPTYRTLDAEPPTFENGRVRVHPLMRELYPRLVELGMLTATRPPEVGGQQLPLTVHALASAYLMAANLSAYAYLGLTHGAAHLLEAFGTAEVKAAFMEPLYRGEWTGTMALTEPQAGSSLADVRTRATLAADGTWRIQGSKIFISGGDQDFSENIVHLTLARTEGVESGTRGISLFAVPARRREGDALVDNDVRVAGVIHKIGWKGIPSLVLNYGESGDCRGWMVGQPGRGLACMFQMMNEARIMVGLNGVATASVAYHEAVAYARERPQGRPVGAKDATRPQHPIIEHADVRRMLLRQKAIVEGGLSLLVTAAYQADLATHAQDEDTRRGAGLLVDLLTPVAKSFPAERGFEANALAVQVHGGYGYSSEYLPEAWLRDQKLNSIHEGTTGIQGLDLLGRKVVAGGGAALATFADAVGRTVARARKAGVEATWGEALERTTGEVAELVAELGARGAAGEVELMLRHSADFLDLFSVLAVAWRWLEQAAAAKEGLARGQGDADFYEGKLATAQYWFAVELPRIPLLIHLCRTGEDSYARMRPEWF
ncbi:acyl-CoA dehydrogenase [Myxococcus sp. CA051A]|uniref:acyl-CoA dehydrogenase n=1 Tax=unclassified Myxococcus TaxID=2648731 RepID=UPI00157B3A2A|nr:MULTISPECIES: acyl-CoA dehydrogenase [unclassified Myxococcus]NTX51500.1 acyl-CoA dehydrogenase [Myxococcus sp. CA039A]NTX65007.1 acyl-CoA dehydrogenase [Myxococcus sp. CA051A]